MDAILPYALLRGVWGPELASLPQQNHLKSSIPDPLRSSLRQHMIT